MTDLSKRLREDLIMPQCMVDQVDTITAAALSGGLGQAVRVAEQALDALDQPAWRPIAEAPTPGGDFRVNYAPGFGAYVSLGDGHHFQDVKATHFMPLPSPPEDE